MVLPLRGRSVRCAGSPHFRVSHYGPDALRGCGDGESTYGLPSNSGTRRFREAGKRRGNLGWQRVMLHRTLPPSLQLALTSIATLARTKAPGDKHTQRESLANVSRGHQHPTGHRALTIDKRRDSLLGECPRLAPYQKRAITPSWLARPNRFPSSSQHQLPNIALPPSPGRSSRCSPTNSSRPLSRAMLCPGCRRCRS